MDQFGALPTGADACDGHIRKRFFTSRLLAALVASVDDGGGAFEASDGIDGQNYANQSYDQRNAWNVAVGKCCG